MAQEYDFEKESEHLSHITKVILHLKKYMEENPAQYPPVIKAYITILFGLIPVLKTQCNGKECRISGQEPCGGIEASITVIDEALSCLDIELDFEAPSFEYPSSYEI